jgi:hypothetical protein
MTLHDIGGAVRENETERKVQKRLADKEQFERFELLA